jgi:hypothetical protein
MTHWTPVAVPALRKSKTWTAREIADRANRLDGKGVWDYVKKVRQQHTDTKAGRGRRFTAEEARQAAEDVEMASFAAVDALQALMRLGTPSRNSRRR